jgi:predicted Zn-dependent protease
LGVASEKAASMISFETERKLFGGFGDLASQATGREAPALQALLSKVAGSAPSASGVSIRAFCSSDLNAFAAPGGQILLTSRLLKDIPSENGLAFVIAHELGHVRLRHPLKALGRGLSIYAMTALFGSFGDEVLSSLARGGGALTALRFSREQEDEADRFAVEAVKRAYGHLLGADELFALISSSGSHRLTQSLPAFMTTHPGTAERISGIRSHPDYQRPGARALPSKFAPIGYEACDGK